MTTAWQRVAALSSTVLLCGACQDVQPGSTLDGPMEQTDMSSGAGTDIEKDGELEVRLGAIERARPQVSLQPRNPFRFGEATVVATPDPVLSPGPDADEPPRFPSVAEVASRTDLRMIGLVDTSASGGRIAVLTDGDVVFHGKEGELVEGRYRIVSVGPTSVEIEFVDDGHRQVLRLAGS